MVQIRKTKRTQADLLDIWLSIASDNLAAADRMVDRIEARLTILLDSPEAGARKEGEEIGLVVMAERHRAARIALMAALYRERRRLLEAEDVTLPRRGAFPGSWDRRPRRAGSSG